MVKKIITIIIIFQTIFIPISNAAGFWDEIIKDGDSFISDGSDLAEDRNRY